MQFANEKDLLDKQMNKLFWWLSANVSPSQRFAHLFNTYSSGLLQGNVFNHKTCSIPI